MKYRKTRILYQTTHMKRIYIFLLLLLALCSVTAQHRRYMSAPKQIVTYSYIADSIIKNFSDSLRSITNICYNRTISTSTQTTPDILVNPYYYRLFVSPLLYKQAIKQAMDLPQGDKSDSLTLDRNLVVNETLNNFYNSLYNKHPYLVHNTDDILEKSGRIRNDINTKIDHNVQVSDIVKMRELDNVVEPIEAISHKPNFWSFSHNVSLQLMQNYANEKWHQGGNNYNSMLARYRFYANYNNKQKVTFNNTLEMNLGFQTNKEDTEHKLKTNEDLLRLTNNLGVQASGKWYYSLQLQSWTQFLPKYNNNSNYVYSDFMSPFESVLSVGMDYKHNKNRFNFNLHIAPLAYDFKYVDRDELRGRYGVKGKHHSYETIGSNITATWNWQILKELSWNSRLYYFTNYNKVQVEWENTFNFTINKYLSSKLYLYPRFDDSYETDRSNAVIQFKEWLSLGLNFSF